MSMHEGDEVQLVAAQLVDHAGQEGANVCLVQVSQSSTQVAVIAFTHTLSRLQQDTTG